MCREYQRGACKRAVSECRFAHPADSVTANEDGTVTVCMDAGKGRCNRDPCRYFHPPLHLQAQIKAAQSRASAVCYAFLGRTLAIFSILSFFIFRFYFLFDIKPTDSLYLFNITSYRYGVCPIFLQANSS